MALALGWGRVEDMLEQMSSKEFVYWQAFFEHEPWGAQRDDHRMGMIASTIVNCTPRGRGARTMKPSDFYHNPYTTKKTQLSEEDREKLLARSMKRGKRRHRRR